MLTIEKVDTANKEHVKRFAELLYRLYKDCPPWVPPLYVDAYAYLDRAKHPFHEHSNVDIFLAVRDGQDVGRIAAIENKPFNHFHNMKKANFYFFDCENALVAAPLLFNRVIAWSKAYELTEVVGPKGMGPLDRYGMLMSGYEHRQSMTMFNYNYPYYEKMIEVQGFTKEVGFVSCFLPADKFQIPPHVEQIAQRVMKRGVLLVNRFVKNMMTAADHRLIKIIAFGDEVVGFLFAFHDVSAALQRARGRLFPFGLIDILRELKRTDPVAVTRMGILPKHQGHGGNAILYSEMGQTLLDLKQFKNVEMTQVAESAVQMRADLKNLNGVEYKHHHVYKKVFMKSTWNQKSQRRSPLFYPS